MARKPILTFDMIEEAEKLLKEGHYAKTVANYFGISEQTWYNWYNKGEEYSQMEDDELINKPNAVLYIEFFESIKRANSRAEMDALNVIHKHSKRKWQAAAWFLERRFRDRWGKPHPDEVGSEGKAQLEQFLKGLDEIVDEDTGDDADEQQ